MSGLPADVANQALDAAGVDFTIGDLEEGTRAAQVCLRYYSQSLMQLLRSAHWDFARQESPLVLLADANRCGSSVSSGAPPPSFPVEDFSGENPNEIGHLVPTGWRFMYAYPIDCMKARFVPQSFHSTNSGPPGNISIPNTPLFTQENQSSNRVMPVRPARFIVATDSNYLPPAGTIDWQVQGVSPTSRTVILTNVARAHLVYTALMIYPSVWDSLFRQAMVAYLAMQIALPLAKDKKLGLEMRNQNIAIFKQALDQARLTNGNEGTQQNNPGCEWLSARNAGAGYGGWGNGGFGEGGTQGVLGYGYDSLSFGGNVY